CIRDLIVDPSTFLSPMAGLTDSVFRRLIKRLGGCGLVMTEFTSAEGLTRNSLKSKRMLFYHEEERPVTAQLFGAEPSRLAEATRMVEDLGFDAIDLNLGCPAKKVVKACGGSALLREIKLLEEILKTIRAATTLPFTIKIRAGWSETEIVSVQVGRMAEDLGINAIAFHPRTRVQGFSGHSDWNLIGQLKAALKIPVIGNGDIVTPEDAFRMKRETGCDGVMIGRGALSNPWIFRQIYELENGLPTTQPDVAAKYQLIKSYFQLLFEEETPGAIGKMKQFASWFTHAIPYGAALRKSIYESQTESEVMERIEEFFRIALVVPESDSKLNVA
ncbi:MAG TPA: tRNA dihydrouridine synthase DusB, partial [Terriglobia bacterium]|nr:tRNA dihydrouridine synthase DusB [Terriglobia bacterium]